MRFDTVREPTADIIKKAEVLARYALNGPPTEPLMFRSRQTHETPPDRVERFMDGPSVRER